METPWKSLDKPSALLNFLRDLRSDENGNPGLGVISVDWRGCLACTPGASPYIQLRDSLPERYQNKPFPIHYGVCTWRKSVAQDLSEPVNRSYKILLYLTRTKKQYFNGERVVETFTNLDEPDYWRPKFPQIFFIDGSKISEASLDHLVAELQGGTLTHPFDGTLSDNYLTSHLELEVHGEAIDEAEMRRVLSGDLNIASSGSSNREHLANCLHQDESVLMQLTNYNLYSAPGDNPEDFMAAATLDACDCVLTTYEAGPSTPMPCQRYDRRNNPPA